MSEPTKENTPIVETVGPESKTVPTLKAILAKKIGMTRVFDEKGEVVPVTVLEAGPCPVLQIKTTVAHGYEAIQVGFGGTKGKNLSKPEVGHFAMAKVSPRQWVEEFRVSVTTGFEKGMEIRADQFKSGDVVDVRGTNKGKGFAGAVKRHRFKGGPQTHGQSDRWRAPGSSGRERVWPGKRGPGHMGAVPSTVQRLIVVRVDAEQNLILIKGSVPGPMGSCVRVYKTTRPKRASKSSGRAATAKKVTKAPAKAAPGKK
ncbi:MAG: 50S ribosomal protein L3 [Elusimicrobia bacterium]|jgi:large subunit ribosomal protein L3|nr:50S ribosomal protein L3 [Elusimicrobiota bacterium]